MARHSRHGDRQGYSHLLPLEQQPRLPGDESPRCRYALCANLTPNNNLDYRATNLLEHWTDLEKVQKLISLGSASDVGKVIGRKHRFDRHYTPTSVSPWDKEGWSLFYTRDRGDEFDQMTFESVPAYVEAFKEDDNCDIEYVYLFQADADGHWEWYVFWQRDEYQEDKEGFAPEGLMRVSDALEFKARLKARKEGHDEEAEADSAA